MSSTDGFHYISMIVQKIPPENLTLTKDLLKEENFTQWVYDKNYHKSDWFYKS